MINQKENKTGGLRCRTLLWLIPSCILLSTVGANAAVIWAEAIDGDLSGDYLNPTVVVPAAVDNQLLYSSVSADREYFTLTINAGEELSAITVDSWTSVDDLSFLAVSAGSTFSTPPTAPGPDPTSMLGYAHFGATDLGLDILQAIGGGPGSQGFSGPLGPGQYTFWAQETGPNAAAATLNFVVTPEPSTALLFGLGLAGLAVPRRRSG